MQDRSETTHAFPIIHSVEGGPSDDGGMLLVEATGFDGSALRFAIPIDNVQHFIAFLLIWVGKITAARESPAEPSGPESVGHLPIPVSSIAIGEPHGGEGYLAIAVGRAELVFSVPIAAISSVGETLLLAGARASSPLS